MVEEYREQVFDICKEITKAASHHMEIIDEENHQFKLCIDDAKEAATAKVSIHAFLLIDFVLQSSDGDQG